MVLRPFIFHGPIAGTFCLLLASIPHQGRIFHLLCIRLVDVAGIQRRDGIFCDPVSAETDQPGVQQVGEIALGRVPG